jgi:Flp pilus assembly protein TadD
MSAEQSDRLAPTMSSDPKAVFLSYASQDAEAARKICEALRASGVEVWFDQSELRGGDAWDAKLRKQIKECALFVPIVSANTQARREGYFRVEWKLAAQRTHAMAEGTPFLLPVVLDGIQESDALVPAEFRDVQWTMLSSDPALGQFCVRLQQLAGNGSPAAPAAAVAVSRTQPAPRPRRRILMVIGIATAFAAGLGLAFIGLRRQSPSATTTAVSDGSISRTAELAHRSSIESPAELDFAVGRAQRAAEAATDSAAAWAALARLQAQYIVRGWDISEQRRQATQVDANRALVLEPDSVDAMFALAVVQLHQGSFTDAEALMRRAIARTPNDAELRQALGTALSGEGRDAEALAVRQENLRLFPRNPFAPYDLALSFERTSPPDLEAAFEKFNESIALHRTTSTVLHKVSLLAGFKGDLPAARQLLDQLDPLERTGDRAVGIAMMLALLQRQPDRAIQAAGLTARTYLDDDYVRGPKAWLLAQAYAQRNKPSLAHAQWQEAETVLRQRMSNTPESWSDQAGLAITLGWLGQQAEAARLMTPLESVARETGQPLQMLYVAYYYAGLADAVRTADALRLVLDRRELVTVKTLPLDPWWDKVRDDPRFKALCAAPTERVVAGPLTEGAQLAARALALITKVGFTRDDLAPAEDFARRATELEPDSAATWGVRAGVQAAWLFRGWDNSEKRRQDTQSFANHALALDSNEPEALLALGHVLRNQGAIDQAAEHLRRAVAANPTHIRLARALGYTLTGHGHDADARAVLLNVIPRAPRDPLLRYELAMTYTTYGAGGAIPENVSGAIEQLDAAIAIQPFSSALILKAALIGGWRGDLPAMRAVLDQLEKLPLAERSEDRSVCIAMWAGLLEHRPDRVEAAAALTARNYFDDFVMPMRPKAWSLALAHRLAGKENLARANWQAAEAVLRQRVKEDPANPTYQVELAITLAWLERRDEAARLVEPIEPVWKEEFRIGRPGLLAMYYAALGHAAKAAPYLAQEVDGTVFTSRRVLPLDPRWDKVRGQPAFDALLKDPPAKP